MRDELFDLPEWRERWLAELDEAAPDASRELLDAPIATEAVVSEDRTVAEPTESPRVSLWQRIARMPRWLRGTVGVCAMLAIVLAVVLALGGGGTPTEELYIIEVNPSMVLLTEDGVVTEVRSLGADGDILLSTPEFDTQVIGKDISLAVVEYVELCVKYGYFNPEGDALRLSARREADDITETVERGLADRGLFGAVISRGLGEGELAEALGVDVADISALLDMPRLFRERLTEGLDESELAEKYEQTVLSGELMDFILSTLERNAEGLRAHALLLDEIWRLDQQIISHGDNPTKFIVVGEGYFGLVDGEHEYTEEFALLMEQMQAKLDKYAADYGKEIVDGAMLALLHTACSPTSTELILGLMEQMSEEVLMEHGEDMIALLSAIGACGEELENIFSLPKSREDFLARLEALSITELNSRFSEYAEDYIPSRDAISVDRLEDFKSGIIAEYGSLEKYFEIGNKK